MYTARPHTKRDIKGNRMLKLAFAGALMVISCLTHAASYCQPIEFAELQTYSEAELKDLKKDYTRKMADIPIGTSPSIKAEFYKETDNCVDQIIRVGRVLKTRFPESNAGASAK